LQWYPTLLFHTLNPLTMPLKFYEFHFAEMDNGRIKNLGILYYQTGKALHKEELISYTREILKKPAAVIRISHIAKLQREEYEQAVCTEITD
jgi:hypothetical protein